MERCSNCQHELTAGFDFCHHCGASSRTEIEAVPAKKNLVEMVDDFKHVATQTASAGASARQSVDDWLGSQDSVQRQVAYSLFTGLALTLSLGWDPVSIGLLSWLEGLLLVSLLLLPLVSYWVVGVVPLSGFMNTLLGEEASVQRRATLAFLWTGTLSTIFFIPRVLLTALQFGFQEGLVSALSGSSLSTFLGMYLVTYYLMGFAVSWIPIQNSGGQIFLNGMAKETDPLTARIREDIEGRGIRALRLGEMAMSTLRRYTAGESTGVQGSQLVLTRGRSRVVLFTQDFGDSLFVRWVSYRDISGRRLWVLFGIFLRGFNSLVQRWTGINLPDYWRAYWSALSPAFALADSAVLPRGGALSRMFGLAEGVSEYTWNEIHALDCSVAETVGLISREAQADHEELGEIQAQVQRNSDLENLAVASSKGSSPTL